MRGVPTMIRPMPPRLTRRASGPTNPFLTCLCPAQERGRQATCPSPIRPACRQAGARITGTDGPVCPIWRLPPAGSGRTPTISFDAPAPPMVASPLTSACGEVLPPAGPFLRSVVPAGSRCRACPVSSFLSGPVKKWRLSPRPWPRRSSGSGSEVGGGIPWTRCGWPSSGWASSARPT